MYSKLYFGKEPNELNYNDIENFFLEEKDESDKIEFKAYHSLEEKNQNEKENGVIRAICALLNSEGGLVIWGAPIGQTKVGKKEKIFQGALSPSPVLIEKDRFISKITDLITPSPKGIRFFPLESSGQYIYIIEVDQSFYSPHQFRNTYYMRIDGQTKPAPHHYIEALFRKVSFPKLEGYLVVDSFRLDNQFGLHYNLQLTTIIFNKSKLQNEYDVYYRVIIGCGTFANSKPHMINPGDNSRIYGLQGRELRFPNAKSTLYYNEPLRNTETIHITSEDIIKENYECKVHIYFSGKQSPLMVSTYTISLKDLNQNDPFKLIVAMDENKFSYEKSDEQEITEEERMKKILGR